MGGGVGFASHLPNLTMPSRDRSDMIEIRRFDAPLGAEVLNIDLRAVLGRDVGDALNRAWLTHQVLLFREQTLEDQHLVDFTRVFGEPELPPNRLLRVADNYAREGGIRPEVSVVSNIKVDGEPIGELGSDEVAWHTDSSFVEVPPAGSILRAIELPVTGGSTYFLDMYAVLDAMADGLRGRIEGRRAKHDPTYTSSGARRKDVPDVADVSQGLGPDHPIIRTHPDTGRQVLYLGRRLNSYVCGLSIEESEALLDGLWAHTLQPQFIYEHGWRSGDVIMWDNRCVMHRRDGFDSSARRMMHRTQIRGTRPF